MNFELAEEQKLLQKSVRPEMQRVLRKDGRVMFVEPWRTLFLSFVHFVSEISIVRRLSNKMDALATMTEHEIRTYAEWLARPELIKVPALTSSPSMNLSPGANGILSAPRDRGSEPI